MNTRDAASARLKTCSLAVALPFLAIAVACAGNDSDHGRPWLGAHQSSVAKPTFEEFAEQSTIVIDGRQMFQIEGDIGLGSEDELRRYYDAVYGSSFDEPGSKPEIELQSVGRLAESAPWTVGTWPFAYTMGLTYCVAREWQGASDNPNRRQFIRDIMRLAGRRWSSQARVLFEDVGDACEDIEDSQGNPVDGEGTEPVLFLVKAWSNDGAQAFYPLRTPRILYMPQSNFTSPEYAASPKQPEKRLNTATHELGHVLGLAHEQGHTDWTSVQPVSPPAGSICDTLPNPANVTDLTEEADACSVMTSKREACGITGDWFTANCSQKPTLLDGAALRYLYGSPPWWTAIW